MSTIIRTAVMNIRVHRGFGHGLKPGRLSDMNCGSCIREDAEQHYTQACGCLKNEAGAHRVRCPVFPEGVRG